MENKRLGIIGIVVLGIVLGICINVIVTKNNTNKLLESVYNAIDGKENTAIYVMRTGCTYCEMFEGTINELKELGYEYIQVDLTDLSEDQVNKLAYKVHMGFLDDNQYETYANYIDKLEISDDLKEEYKDYGKKNYISEENANNINEAFAAYLDEDDAEAASGLVGDIGAYSTPTVSIVGNGKVVDQHIGYATPDEFYDFLIKNEIIDSSKKLSINYPTLDEVIDMVDDGEEHIMVLAKSSCSHCINFHQVILDYLKEDKDLEINYLYLDYIITSEEDNNKLYDTIPWLNEDDNFSGTPTTIVVKDGKVISSAEGELTIGGFADFINSLND